ncbi:unnamed protein product, partial [Coregonus sp. 'balchen']
TKSGIALLYNKETSNTYDVRLKLTKEVLTIQKLDVVCTRGGDPQFNAITWKISTTVLHSNLVSTFLYYFTKVNSHFLKHRTVVLRRQAAGGLGLSIKGGAEHKVPVVISKMFKDQVVMWTETSASDVD